MPYKMLSNGVLMPLSGSGIGASPGMGCSSCGTQGMGAIRAPGRLHPAERVALAAGVTGGSRAAAFALEGVAASRGLGSDEMNYRHTASNIYHRRNGVIYRRHNLSGMGDTFTTSDGVTTTVESGQAPPVGTLMPDGTTVTAVDTGVTAADVTKGITTGATVAGALSTAALPYLSAFGVIPKTAPKVVAAPASAPMSTGAILAIVLVLGVGGVLLARSGKKSSRSAAPAAPVATNRGHRSRRRGRYYVYRSA